MKATPTSSPSPEPEVQVPASGKRVFSMAYKRRILQQLDGCSHLGEKSALLRREGLHSSYVERWRKQLANDGSSPTVKGMKKSRGGRPRLSEDALELRRLRTENARIKRELERAELTISIQKKLSELLESYSPQSKAVGSNSTPPRSS